MTEEHYTLLLTAAEAKKDDQGFMVAGQGRTWSLYVASGAASLTVSKIEALRAEKDLVRARTVKGELFILCMKDVYAGAVDAGNSTARKAGFV